MTGLARRVADLEWEDVRRALRSRPVHRFDPPLSQRAAVAVVLRRKSAERALQALLVRRAQHADDPWSGHMAFPGGRFEDGDENVQATAVRETAEETGLALDRRVDLLGALDELRASGGGRALDLSIAPFVFRCEGTDRPRLSDELVSAHWVDLDLLFSPLVRGRLGVVVDDRTCAFPCLRVDGQTVWGLTYGMLADLAVRLGAPALPG